LPGSPPGERHRGVPPDECDRPGDLRPRGGGARADQQGRPVTARDRLVAADGQPFTAEDRNGVNDVSASSKASSSSSSANCSAVWPPRIPTRMLSPVAGSRLIQVRTDWSPPTVCHIVASVSQNGSS